MRQPLREAVSWNILSHIVFFYFKGQPLREAVSWNSNRQVWYVKPFCQPLREAVSWNIFSEIRSWIALVSLFVRLWVEISNIVFSSPCVKSASSWGCELKYWISSVVYSASLPSASSWGCELKYKTEVIFMSSKVSASSWGCELKLYS